MSLESKKSVATPLAQPRELDRITVTQRKGTSTRTIRGKWRQSATRYTHKGEGEKCHTPFALVAPLAPSVTVVLALAPTVTVTVTLAATLTPAVAATLTPAVATALTPASTLASFQLSFL